jgi:SNF2 family DNA or RNA helicase
MLKKGQIIKNLIDAEPVSVLECNSVGDELVAIQYVGVNTQKRDSIIIDENRIEKLDLLTNEDEFNFKGDPGKFLLFAEAERINSAYQFDPLFAVNCSVIDPLPHQVEAVYKYLLPLPKIRFLLADDTGAGKTIMAGLLIKEMIMRGMLERILIVTPGGLTKQWQEDEMGLKFNLNFKLADRAAFNSDPNIFSTSDRLVTSIDFIRNDDVRNVLESTTWDMIIFDEAHKLSAFEYGRKRYLSLRYKVAEMLATRTEHLMLLTATPHRGRADTFRYLLQLLDDDIFATDYLVTSRVQEVSEGGVNKFFIRRLKEEMKDWEGNPLFKERFTKTVKYKLTDEEKLLYDNVTRYLSKRRKEAYAQNNQYVSLALMVMQRRLTSSIFAIMKTLKNRHSALQGLLDELAKNPSLFKQRGRIDFEASHLDEYDELDDDERESLENILADPRQFKLFTTAQSKSEIEREASEVKGLYQMALDLYNSDQEEQKYRKLKDLLRQEGVLEEDEKLVIFTEHKDTMNYLTDRLSNNGYSIVNIHGGMSVDERRSAQNAFATDTKILIATDAAGEGINLQFCRLLINWDIPWNPNRLEQRMGRIHRYGQKSDVVVFNMVAQNTREGQVLERLLTKLDIIREQMGDDRVFDVISDVFENVSLEEIIHSTLDGEENSYNTAIEQDLTEENVEEKIRQQREKIGHSLVDYSKANELKESSDERRLQPIYVKMFFEKALKDLGGSYTEIRQHIFRIDTVPQILSDYLKKNYNISVDIRDIYFCFDKTVFLENQRINDLERVHYINPGNPVFDSMVGIIRQKYREHMLRGTVLVSPDDSEEYFAYFVKSQIGDNRSHNEDKSIADERIALVQQMGDRTFSYTSPAKFIDLEPPVSYAKSIETPHVVDKKEVENWSFQNITRKQFEETQKRVKEDAQQRIDYLNEAFTNIILDLTEDYEQQHRKAVSGDEQIEEKLNALQVQIQTLKKKKSERLEKLQQMQQLSMKMPEVLGCAYVVPLSQIEYEKYFGMKRDDEVERIAMDIAMNFEEEQGWVAEDVGSQNLGYDIRSTNPDHIKRYIEVKGRSTDGGVMLSENEMNRLAQLGQKAWLYIVTQCKTEPQLYRFQNPANTLNFEKKLKGVQYFLSAKEWTKEHLG